MHNNRMGCSSMVEYHIVMSGDVGSIPSNPSFLLFLYFNSQVTQMGEEVFKCCISLLVNAIL